MGSLFSTCTGLPKYKLVLGLRLVHSSFGVVETTLEVTKFMMSCTIIRANQGDIHNSSMILPYPRESLFLISATPFCYNEPGANFWDVIPWSLRNCLNSPKRYSSLLSNRGDLILLPRCIPTPTLLSLISQRLQTYGASIKCIHCLSNWGTHYYLLLWSS